MAGSTKLPQQFLEIILKTGTIQYRFTPNKKDVENCKPISAFLSEKKEILLLC
jgi:hypothetical protein